MRELLISALAAGSWGLQCALLNKINSYMKSKFTEPPLCII